MKLKSYFLFKHLKTTLPHVKICVINHVPFTGYELVFWPFLHIIFSSILVLALSLILTSFLICDPVQTRTKVMVPILDLTSDLVLTWTKVMAFLESSPSSDTMALPCSLRYTLMHSHMVFSPSGTRINSLYIQARSTNTRTTWNNQIHNNE